MRIYHKTQLFLLFIFITLGASTILGMIELAGVALPLLLLESIYFIGVERIRSISADNITIEKVVSGDYISEGETLDVTITVTNTSNQDIPVVDIVDILPQETTVVHGSNHLIFQLKAGERIKLNYSIKTHKRGRYTIGPVIVRTTDLLERDEKVFKKDVRVNYTCIPRFIKLRKSPSVIKRMLLTAGSLPSKDFHGRSFDFQGIRDYFPGDEFRLINWRSSAKFNTLMTNEFALDQQGEIYIILDHTPSAYRVLEESIIVTQSLLEYFIRTRNKVGLFLIHEFVEQISAGVGKKHLFKMIEKLTDSKIGYPVDPEVLIVRTKDNLTSIIKRNRCAVFIVSTLMDPILVSMVKEIKDLGIPVSWIRPIIVNDYQEMFDEGADYFANFLEKAQALATEKQMIFLNVPRVDWCYDGTNYYFLQNN